jgi:hypothetical protein
MTSQIGALNVRDHLNGYWLVITDNGPADWLAEMRGGRVLIPGSAGLYTPPTDPFEPERLVIRYHAFVFGAGSTHEDIRASYETRITALKTACDAAGREDVTLLEDDWTAAAGLLRFEGPSAEVFGGEAREFEIVFEATNPPEWTAS